VGHPASDTSDDRRFAALVAGKHNHQPSADDYFNFGFDLLLTGLRAMLRAQ